MTIECGGVCGCEQTDCPNQARPVDISDFIPVLEEVLEKIKRSIEKHGPWADYDATQIFEAVAGEFDEYREAFLAQHVQGRHGQIAELYDVMVTAAKGIRRLSCRD